MSIAVAEQTQTREDSSLSGGAAGNSNEIRRLACVFELNQRRVGQLQAAEADLPKSPKS